MKTLRFIVLILFFAVFIFSTAAQSDFDNDYDWPNGIRLSFPDGWEIVEQNDIIHLRSEDSDMLFLFEDYDEGVEEAIEALYNRVRNDASIDFESEDIVFGGLADFDDAASYFYEDNLEDEEFQRALFAIPIEERIIVQVAAVPLAGSEIEELNTVLDILATLSYDAERVEEESSDDETILYEWSSGVQMEYPQGWQPIEDGDHMHFVSEEIDIAIFFYPVRDERETNHAAGIRQTFDRLSTRNLDEESFYFLSLSNDDEAIGYFYEETEDGFTFEQVMIALQPDELFIAVAVALPRSQASFEDVGGLEQIYEILGTMRME